MTSNTTTQKRNKRHPLVAFGLAALAVGGVGAAITSAAWTDNTFFSAPAAAATFDLQGSLDGKAWTQSGNADAVELVIPASQFANLLPAQTRTIDLWVRNESSVNAALTSQVAFASNSTFTTKPTASVSGLITTLTPTGSTGAQDQFQLTVTTPADWAPVNQGKSGTVVVTVSATATS
ncbi:hypothetical protein [Microbacterium aerolatum]|uniref:Ribosomally synthesized peptide with SipW-like signal peptide n=1 Tax=Microbacterium aerolatum TaxID=153731 RepID=A0A511AFC6_9MICO|nr:hypothetical protein [Microbacterium aerolatum]GEK86839.1 hypothetical protein MAE01_20150 [Microbacterium aerolatum]GGB24697.1 hypothetical protein GCM10007198_13800 [Microbacterium aerolatum]